MSTIINDAIRQKYLIAIRDVLNDASIKLSIKFYNLDPIAITKRTKLSDLVGPLQPNTILKANTYYAIRQDLATGIVLATVEPTEGLVEGLQWFNEVIDTLYTYTEGAWDAGEVIATVAQTISIAGTAYYLTQVANSLQWFDEAINTLYTYSNLNCLFFTVSFMASAADSYNVIAITYTDTTDGEVLLMAEKIPAALTFSTVEFTEITGLIKF
jgi:hypothetical protein